MTQYITATILSLLCTLVLVYGTIFESKDNIGPNVKNAFLYMLGTSVVVNLANLLVVLLGGRVDLHWMLRIFATVYFAGTFLITCFFTIFLYRYISYKKKISKAGFKFAFALKGIAIFMTLIACFWGKLYTFTNDGLVEGEFFGVFIMIFILLAIIDLGVMLNYGKVLGRHDAIAFSSYIFLPVIGAIVGVWVSDRTIPYSFLTVSFLIIYVMVHAEQERIYSNISNQDQLTGLNNRRAFDTMRVMAYDIGRAGIVFTDVNGLKYMNDTYGHEAGDKLICDVAKILEACFRKNELYRIGGDEFVAFMPGVSEEALCNRSEKLTTMLSETGIPLAAIGVAYTDSGDINEVFKLAEARMYEQKEEHHSKYPNYVRDGKGNSGEEMKKGIIFDMDGTLWDSAENVANSWNTIIEQPEYGMTPLTKDDFYRVMGMSMDQLGETLWGDVEIGKRNEMLEKCYLVENSYIEEHGGELYPELEETLAKLKENYKLYIVSNCQSGYIEAFLNHYKFWDYFEDIECFGNNNRKKGENIADIVKRNSLDKAVYVGDIQGDYDSTMEAGIDFIHAAYGFGTINVPVAKIDKFSDLLTVAQEILG